MRLRVVSQVILLYLMGTLVLSVGELLPNVWADDVYLKEGAHSIQGRVVSEKENAVIVEIPKDQIRLIKRGDPPPEAPEKTSSVVQWEERGDVVVLTVPKQMLHVVSKGTSDAATLARAPSQQSVLANDDIATAQAPTTPDPHLGSVVGRVLWDGQPVENCRVKVVQVNRMDSLGLAARLLGGSEAEAAKEAAEREVVTDAMGRYRIERLLPGEYDVYWKTRGNASWIRRLHELPDLLILAGEATTYPDIKAHVQTVN